MPLIYPSHIMVITFCCHMALNFSTQSFISLYSSSKYLVPLSYTKGAFIPRPILAANKKLFENNETIVVGGMFLWISHFLVALTNLSLTSFRTPLRTCEILGCLFASDLCARGSIGPAALLGVCLALWVETSYIIIPLLGAKCSTHSPRNALALAATNEPLHHNFYLY